MYIDFHKYNYDLVPAVKRAEYVKRRTQLQTSFAKMFMKI